MAKIKGLRRTIIFLCLTILIISNLYSLPEGKYYNDNLKNLVKKNQAEVMEVGKSFKIDNSTIYIKRIITTEETSYIRYSFRRWKQGWSFSGSAIKIIDDQGREYQGFRGGGSTGKIWGQDGLMGFERIAEDAEYIILKLDWYDRSGQLKISLKEVGEANED